jgi:transcriptional regulator with XRE-family HTH domain
MHDALKTPEGLRALAERDITTVYRLLNEAGVPQRDIAAMAGQTQSEVSEILKGRRVMSYNVMEKIAEGLDIPRGTMGLAYDEGLLPSQGQEVEEDVKRRELLASAGIALFDRPVLGQVLGLAKPSETPTPLPAQLGNADLIALDALTVELRSWSQRWGGGAATIGEIACRSERLLTVPASDSFTPHLHSALAKLRLVAGWAAFDECLDDTARDHFGRAISPQKPLVIITGLGLLYMVAAG